MTINESGAARFVEGEYAAPLLRILGVVRKRLWIAALVTVLLTGAALGFSLAQTPTYEASIKILVGQEQGITEDPNEAVGLQQLTQTMTEAVNNRPLAEAVIRRQGLRTTPEDFLENLNVEQVSATQFIEVSYEDSDPQRAQQVANSVGEEFSRRISELSRADNTITATVWEPAVVPEEPVSPDPLRNGLLALALGLMLGLGLAFLLEYLDDSWSSSEEAEQVSGVPTFGIIPEFQTSSGGKKKGYSASE